MEDLGTRLKQAREAQGISLKDIAARTKIAATALEALERNDFSRLPGGIFGRAFVRSYAIEIGMDPEATVNDFQIRLAEIERAAAERGAVRPEVTADDREFLARQQRALRALRVGLVVLAMALAATAVWVFGSRRVKQASVEPGPAAVEAIALPTVAPPSLAVPDKAVALDVPGDPSGALSGVPGGPESAPGFASGVLADSGLGSALAGQIGAAAGNGPLSAEIEATADGWVWVMADGQIVANRLFRAGEHQKIEAGRELRFDLANAGGVKLLLNGSLAKSLGQPGERARAQITRETLTQFLQ